MHVHAYNTVIAFTGVKGMDTEGVGVTKEVVAPLDTEAVEVKEEVMAILDTEVMELTEEVMVTLDTEVMEVTGGVVVTLDTEDVEVTGGVMVIQDIEVVVRGVMVTLRQVEPVIPEVLKMSGETRTMDHSASLEVRIDSFSHLY